jgi:hypothetical protein
MSRHEKDLEDMHDLLQQMKDMHAMGYDVPDHCEGWVNDMKQKAAKRMGYKTDQDKIVEFFDQMKLPVQKTSVETYIKDTINNNDVFFALTNIIASKDTLMNIIEEKDPEAARDDSAMYAKMKDDPRIKDARAKFRKYDNTNQKKDLEAVLNKIFSEGKTPKDVLNELVLQMGLRNEIKKKWDIK